MSNHLATGKSFWWKPKLRLKWLRSRFLHCQFNKSCHFGSLPRQRSFTSPVIASLNPISELSFFWEPEESSEVAAKSAPEAEKLSAPVPNEIIMSSLSGPDSRSFATTREHSNPDHHVYSSFGSCSTSLSNARLCSKLHHRDSNSNGTRSKYFYITCRLSNSNCQDFCCQSSDGAHLLINHFRQSPRTSLRNASSLQSLSPIKRNCPFPMQKRSLISSKEGARAAGRSKVII